MPPAPLPHNDPDAEIAEILREAMSARRVEQVAPEPSQQSEAGRGQASVGRIADDAPPKAYGSGAAAPLGIKFETDDQKQSLQRSQLTGRFHGRRPATTRPRWAH